MSGQTRRYRFKEAIRSWPTGDRPAEKLALDGASFLTDPELLSLLTDPGADSPDSVDLARELIRRFGSLPGIERATVSEIASVNGMDSSKAVAVKAGLEMGRRFVASGSDLKQKPIETSLEAFDCFFPMLKNLKQEHFVVALLNTRHKLQKCLMISAGGLDASIIKPRDVFAHALRESSPALLMAHNHPSGDPTPSPADKKLTNMMVEAGKVMSIEVLDHLIIGDGIYYSFSDEGYIN